MKRFLLIFIFFLQISITVFPQKLTEPILLGTWNYGYEDWYEFMYKRLSAVEGEYLQDDPNGKIIARICSKDKFPKAFVTSTGVAFQIDKKLADFYRIPFEKIYFAVSSTCLGNSLRTFEEYWFIPENKQIEYNEILAAQKVSVERILTNDVSKNRARVFTNDLAKFVKILKDNPEAKGFIVKFSNTKIHRKLLKRVENELKKGNISFERIEVVKNTRSYSNYFPEMITVTISN